VHAGDRKAHHESRAREPTQRVRGARQELDGITLVTGRARFVTAGTLHVSSTPAFSFQWWTNSLGSALVRSFGSAQLGIFTLDRLGNVGGGPAMAMKQWDEQMTQQIRFDFGSNSGTPLSVQMDVNPTLIYALWVSLDVHVEGVGWPGSLASSIWHLRARRPRY